MEKEELKEVGTQLESVADALVGASESGVKAESVAEASVQIEEIMENTENLEKGKQRLKGKVRKRNAMIVILVIIIVLLLLKDYIFKSLDKEVIVPEFEDGTYIERVTEDIVPAPDVHLPMYESFIVDESYPYGTLYNPEINAGNYHVAYSFVLEGETEPFYETKYIQAGDKISVNFWELLPEGEHKVIIYPIPVAVDTYEQKSTIADVCMIKVNK